MIGSSVGAKVFTEHGWRVDSALNVAWTALALAILLVRGPHVSRRAWFGWAGRTRPVLAGKEASCSSETRLEDGVVTKKDEGCDVEKAKAGVAASVDMKVSS